MSRSGWSTTLIRTANPHLDYVLTEAVDAVTQLRDEGKTVLLHCVQAQSRTPTVAALSAARRTGRHPDEIVREAAESMRDRYERFPHPYGLLEHPFTMAALRGIHEAVLGAGLLKDTFPAADGVPAEAAGRGGWAAGSAQRRGRPAQVYERAREVRSSAQVQRRLQLPRASR